MITKVSVNDGKSVYRLLCDWMKRTFDYDTFEREFGGYIEDEHNTAVVAKEGDTVIGFMNVRIDFQLHHMGNVAEILELAVERPCRGSEVEKELVAYAVSLAKEQRCDCIEVCTRRTNEKAHRFFEREGFNKSHYKLKMPLKY